MCLPVQAAPGQKRMRLKPTGKELTYAGAPMRGKKWFERMKADHKDDILRAAQALADRRGN